MLRTIAGLVLLVGACVLQVRERQFIERSTQTVGFLSGWDEETNDDGDSMYTGVVTYYAGRARLQTRLKVSSSWQSGELGTLHPVRYRTENPRQASLGDLWLILTMLAGFVGLGMLTFPALKRAAESAPMTGIRLIPACCSQV